MDKTYWAVEFDPKKFTSKAEERIREYREWLRDTGRASRSIRSWRTYYGYANDGVGDTTEIRQGGKQGELAEMNTNTYAALVKQRHVLITGSKQSVKAIATNTDFKSMAKASLATGISEHYDRKFSVSEREAEAVFYAILLSEGWLVQSWEPSLGEARFVDENGQPQREGDIAFTTLTHFDVVFDFDRQDFDSLQWVMFKKKCNRWDLAAQYPDSKEDILAYSEELKKTDEYTLDARQRAGGSQRTNPDLVDVWEFRHIRSPACPNGRLVRFVGSTVISDTVQYDEETGEYQDNGYPYSELHAFRVAPETQVGYLAGHTSQFDLLGPQQAIDMAATMLVSAANAGGISNVWTPPGQTPNVMQLAGGLNLIQTDVKPETLNPIKLDPVVMELMGFCEDVMRRRVGLNDVALGEPTKGMPAQAMALLQAQAVQYNSDLSRAYQRLVERNRTGIIKMLQAFAKSTRVAQICGKANTWQLKEFTKDDLDGIDRIAVESLNPASQTFAGKFQMAQTLLEMGVIKRPEQLFSFIESGRLEPLYDAEAANLMRLRQEKEMLQEGVGIPPVNQMGEFQDDGQNHIRPLASDTHWIDIPEYAAVLASPDARNNPEVTKAVLNAIMYKIDLWRSMDPALIDALGGRPAPAPYPVDAIQQQQFAGAQAQPQAPQQQQPQQQPGQAGQAVLNVNSPQAQVKQPKPPPNPITGEQAEAPIKTDVNM